MQQAVVYKIVNLENGNFYVGSTNNQRERFRTHRSKLRNNKHHCAHLQAAWNKYGEEVFLFRVIETIVDESKLQQAEDVWLSEWVGKDGCYNHGLRSGAPWRGVAKELHPMYGRIMSEEQKAVLRKARMSQQDPRLGKSHSEETKQRIREAKLANPTRAWLGKQRSEETKAKISASQKGVKKKPRTFTHEGFEKAKENMRRNAVKMEVYDFEVVKAKFPAAVLDMYNFDNAVYLGALIRIEGICCPKHGIFSQYAAQLRKGSACPSCGAEKRAESKRKQMKEAWSTEEGRSVFMANRSEKDVADAP